MGRNLKTSEPEEILRKGLSQMRTADGDIPVPGDLFRMIEGTVDRELGRRHGRMRLVASISAIGVAAVVAAVAFLSPLHVGEPEDTFDNPEEAYAAVVEALELIGQNLNKGMSFAAGNIEEIGCAAFENFESVVCRLNREDGYESQ
ncbi:MAG TPA: hypothetical protein IAC04_04520 [Candidatus Coprenecus stercoravium]|uniref:Uncharacterized protein n=1 Tax=Candidatus Coprenecus stercoravium TaxID=2840735 RepID=A0A9D2GPD4_9BACT|nr:hypothetical protein [Candidatus Coprenecus stercoravium]